MLMRYAKKNVEIHELLEDYVEAITRTFSPNVKLENTQNLFLFFGGFLALVSFAFLFDIVLLKQLKKNWRKLARCPNFKRATTNREALFEKNQTTKNWKTSNEIQLQRFPKI